MNKNELGAAAPTSTQLSLSLVGGLEFKVSEKTHQLVRTIVKEDGAIRVTFWPVNSKEKCIRSILGNGTVKAGQGAAKSALKAAKRELAAGILAQMVHQSGRGRFCFRSATVSKSGTVGVFFDSGEAEDTAALTEAEERAQKAEAELAELKSKLATTEAAK